MASMIDRDETVRELQRVGVDPPDWLDEWLADQARGQADPFVFLPSQQGLVPVLCWTDGLRNAVLRALQAYDDNTVIIDSMELSQTQRVALDEAGVTWLVQAQATEAKKLQTIRLDAAAATRLLDFLLLYQDELVRWRDGLTQ